ncbi:MAG TPA: VOC family protein [Nitrososphaeraceae archaeon]|nr:VOC family protein [Nitrososphaeraceae archaeon]
MKVYKISAVTLIIKNMERSCNFYSQIPGFKVVYGGTGDATFTTYEIVESDAKMYLNLELGTSHGDNCDEHDAGKRCFGRIIFSTEDVDKLYRYFKQSESLSKTIYFENEPTDASWGERYFHIREPDGYQLSFATPLNKRKKIKNTLLY